MLPMNLIKCFLLLCVLMASTSPALCQNPAPDAVPEIPPPIPAAQPIPKAPHFELPSYLLMDFESGQVLVQKDIDQRLEPASITKVLAAYVLFQELKAGRLKLEDQVLMSEKAWRTGMQGSRMFVPVNSKTAARDLLMGMIVQSGNDATVALAEHIAGTEEAFVGLMNQNAARLGMKNTHFTNATGMPEERHYTTARDLATLARAVIEEFPDYYQWYSVREFGFNNIKQYNRNTLLTRDPSVDGMKTGHTESAGFCLLSSAKRGPMRLIAVVMGSESEKIRADQSAALLNYGFRFFESHMLYSKSQPLREQETFKGAVDRLQLGPEQAVGVVIPRGRYGDLKAVIEMPEVLIAPISKGQKLGVLRVKLDETILAEQDLIALDEVPEGGFLRRMSDGIALWWRGS
jgi:D-alanyl-D-alanine carboxypeptidase (penicillin-binding protein 5/6)